MVVLVRVNAFIFDCLYIHLDHHIVKDYESKIFCNMIIKCVFILFSLSVGVSSVCVATKHKMLIDNKRFLSNKIHL